MELGSVVAEQLGDDFGFGLVSGFEAPPLQPLAIQPSEQRLVVGVVSAVD